MDKIIKELEKQITNAEKMIAGADADSDKLIYWIAYKDGLDFALRITKQVEKDQK